MVGVRGVVTSPAVTVAEWRNKFHINSLPFKCALTSLMALLYNAAGSLLTLPDVTDKLMQRP